MLEPLFRCNLACAGCGKIDYPTPILNRRLSVQECLDAADECGAPVVSIPGGEPLIHKDIAEIVKGLIARRKFVYLCTNALLVEKKIDLFEPSPYLTFSIHLDGLRAHHDRSVCQDGVFDRAVAAIRLLRGRGFRVNVNATLFDGVGPGRRRRLLRLRDRRARRRGHHRVARLRLRAGARSGALSQPAQDQGAVPRHLPPRPADASAPGSSAIPRCTSISSPATSSIAARRGAIRPATSSAGSGRAICSPRATPPRSRSSWRDRLGQLRHRQLREMRQLHGALRLRGDRGHRTRSCIR